MINIDVSSKRSSSNLIQLEESATKHLNSGKKCELFFSSYGKLKLTAGGLSLTDYSNNLLQFSEMYRQISDGYIEKCEGDYERLENEAMLLESMAALTIEEVNKNEEYTSRLIEIKKKIDLCKNIDDVFCKGVIELFQKAPQTLQYGDALFFLPTQGAYSGTIGECHCDESLMGRNPRRAFSESLCDEISNVFSTMEPLTIASIGAGLCFHELEIHALLTAKGYQIDGWVIVDPDLLPKTVANFETLLQWQNRQVKVLVEQKRCNEYFAQIEKGSCATVPNVCLFIDVDLHISSNRISQISAQMTHRCLLAEFKKEGGEEAWSRTNFYMKKKT